MHAYEKAETKKQVMHERHSALPKAVGEIRCSDRLPIKPRIPASLLFQEDLTFAGDGSLDDLPEFVQ